MQSLLCTMSKEIVEFLSTQSKRMKRQTEDIAYTDYFLTFTNALHDASCSAVQATPTQYQCFVDISLRWNSMLPLYR